MPILHELAHGARLHVVVSLFRANGLPTTKRQVKAQWGGALSDESIADAARWLVDNQVAVTVPNGRWPALQLTNTGRQLVLPAALTPLPADSTLLSAPVTPPPAESTLAGLVGVDSAPSGVKLPETGLTPPPAESNGQKGAESAPSGVSSVDDDESINLKSTSEKILGALLDAGVFRNVARKPAKALAGRPGYFGHLVAHIAFSQSSDCRQLPGVYLADVVTPIVKDDEWAVGPMAYMPPEGLTLAEMLDWARLGETTAAWYDRAAPSVALPEVPVMGKMPDQATGAAGAVLPVPPLWAAALAQLKLEMPKHTFETWVRVCGLEERGGVCFVICPNGYTKDWLENRLHGAVKRTLSGLSGRAVEVKFELARQDNTTGGNIEAPCLV